MTARQTKSVGLAVVVCCFGHYLFLLHREYGRTDHSSDNLGLQENRKPIPDSETKARPEDVTEVVARQTTTAWSPTIVESTNAEYREKKDNKLAVKLLARRILGNRSERSVLEDAAALRSLLESDLDVELKDTCAIFYLDTIPFVEQKFEVIRNLKPIQLLKNSIIAHVAGHAATWEPDAAIELLEDLPWAEEFGPAYSKAFVTLALRNSRGTSERITLLKNTPRYDWGVAGLVQAIRSSDPESAKIWTNEIKDQKAYELANSKSITLSIGG
jgi:hypothetical protein